MDLNDLATKIFGSTTYKWNRQNGFSRIDTPGLLENVFSNLATKIFPKLQPKLQPRQKMATQKIVPQTSQNISFHTTTSTPYSRFDLTPDEIKQVVTSTWGADTPILNNIDMMIEAGNRLPKNMDPYMPLILSLRETQGGKDLIDPTKNAKLGKNNPYNIRGVQNGVIRFIDYPSLQVATFGGSNGTDTSEGLVGLLSRNPIYAAFRQSGDLKDFFKHWSPPTDNNGNLDEQVQNYQWIRNRFRKK